MEKKRKRGRRPIMKFTSPEGKITLGTIESESKSTYKVKGLDGKIRTMDKKTHSCVKGRNTSSRSITLPANVWEKIDGAVAVGEYKNKNAMIKHALEGLAQC